MFFEVVLIDVYYIYHVKAVLVITNWLLSKTSLTFRKTCMHLQNVMWTLTRCLLSWLMVIDLTFQSS